MPVSQIQLGQDQPLRNNAQIAERLAEVAELLRNQGANPFRVRAYETGADTVRRLNRPLEQVVAAEGDDGLLELRGIGPSIARGIEQLLSRGKWDLLERLRGETEPQSIFVTVPSIGPELAVRIHDTLGIDTLAELEAAAWDGRLARVPGIGSKRIQGVRESLAGRFLRKPPSQPKPVISGSIDRQEPVVDQPSVEELLLIDQRYRELAAADRLPRVAPRRFNPTHQAWLPIFHTTQGNRQYTALYSNSARAHEMGATRDWVVIYRDDDGGQGRWTVITSLLGRLKGKRIVRSREAECVAWYAHRESGKEQRGAKQLTLALFDKLPTRDALGGNSARPA